MQNRKFNNPKKECKTLKNIEKKTGWVPGAPHKTDPRADPPDEPNLGCLQAVPKHQEIERHPKQN